jgi:hypothetical protein
MLNNMFDSTVLIKRVRYENIFKKHGVSGKQNYCPS